MSSGNVVLVIAASGFRDEEYLEPKKILQEAGFEVLTVSSRTGECTGMLGARAIADKTLPDIVHSDFDAIVFIGGTGSSVFWDDPVAHDLLRRANDHGKIIGGICIAPVTLHRAGLLDGKKITAFPSVSSEFTGSEYTGRGVETDGNIITASGPESAILFGNKIKELLVR